MRISKQLTESENPGQSYTVPNYFDILNSKKPLDKLHQVCYTKYVNKNKSIKERRGIELWKRK